MASCIKYTNVLLEAVNHGIVDAAFHKPVDVHDLQQVVRRLLELA